jgi:hypothetical protein
LTANLRAWRHRKPGYDSGFFGIHSIGGPKLPDDELTLITTALAAGIFHTRS